jgi:prenyltransferase beta subunit
MNRFALILIAGAFCLAPARAQTADERKQTVEYVRGLQIDGSGFLAAKTLPGGAGRAEPSLRASSSALRALKYFGGEPRDAKACAKFAEGCWSKTAGGFSDLPSSPKPDVFSTAVGLMAVVELKLPPEAYVEPALKFLANNAKDFEQVRIAAAGLEAVGKRPKIADAWLDEIAKLRNADGTYGKGAGAARDTGGAVAAVLRLGGKVEQRDNVVKALKDGQRPDGGYGKADAKVSDLETTYRVLRALHMLKEKPDVAKLREFIAKCRNADGGYGVAPGDKSSVGGTYFAGIVLHWLEEK